MNDERRDRSDLFSLLALADELQTRLETTERTLLTIRMAQAALLVLSLTGAGASILLTTPTIILYQSRVPFAVTLVIVGCAYAGFIELTVVARARKRLNRDTRALQGIVPIVQDAAASAMSSATALERVELAIRLSRFDIYRSGGSGRTGTFDAG